MISRQDALTEREFHAEGGCTLRIGPRGGQHVHMEIWRVNGAPRTWKTREDVVVPVKHGMYDYGLVLVPQESSYWHTRANCPVIRHFQSEEN